VGYKIMRCSECGTEAVAICKFCGRAVCGEHIKTEIFVSGYTSVGGLFSTTQNAVRVEDAVLCGICHPIYKLST
jgi:hypothetical protein